jgi:DNA-binding response OmpR family regulator
VGRHGTAVFTVLSQSLHGRVTTRAARIEMLTCTMEAAQRSQDDVLYVGALEIRPLDGLVMAGGRALNLSVREFGLLVALARSGGGIVRREDLYARVWGGALRGGDRSIDVYIHKLRVKLEESLPDWRFIHTHVGFGYRFAPEPSHHFHNASTSP